MYSENEMYIHFLFGVCYIRLGSPHLQYFIDNNDEEEVDVFKKKSRGKKTLRSTKRPGKQTRKQQNISDEKESRV